MIYHPILSGSKGLKSFISFTESEMSLKEEIFRKAAKNPKRILFPEGEDERILQAASELAVKGIGEPVVIFRKRKSRRLNGWIQLRILICRIWRKYMLPGEAM